MQQPENITINHVNWQNAEAYLRQVRTIVFIQEQLVAPELEWDEMDSSALHLLRKNRPHGSDKALAWLRNRQNAFERGNTHMSPTWQ